MGTLGGLAVVFAQLSLLAFGGTNSVLPEMQRQVVEVHPWLTAREFASLFALAQAAPGPNMLVVTLVGWQVAAVPGALVTTVAVSLPSSILTFAVGGMWQRFRSNPWRQAIQAGLLPVTAGLVLASAALLTQATTVSCGAAVVTAAAVLLFLLTRLHPLLLLAGAAAIGAAGLV
ncbi:MAG: chromate transporter [Acetobacteraceae bacterium]|nr:chromate transporter [Acetobacteraceae bacterium]